MFGAHKSTKVTSVAMPPTALRALSPLRHQLPSSSTVDGCKKSLP